MAQDELNIKETYQNPLKSTNLVDNAPMVYRNWKIWWWDNDDKKHIEFIKQPDIDSVIQYCQFRGIVKYTIFDDKFKNVNNDGKRVLMG